MDYRKELVQRTIEHLAYASGTAKRTDNALLVYLISVAELEAKQMKARLETNQKNDLVSSDRAQGPVDRGS